MAPTEERNFHRTAATVPESVKCTDEEPEKKVLQGSGSVGMKRGLLCIDLNVVPPEDGGSDTDSGFEFDENRGENKAHFSKGEITPVTGSGENIRYWDALLDASNNALRDYEESARGEGEKARNRKRGPEGGGGELQKGAGRVRKRVNNGGCSLAEIHAAAAPVVVARSTRGRAVAMPSKYKDSVLHAAEAVVAEVRSSRRRSR